MGRVAGNPRHLKGFRVWAAVLVAGFSVSSCGGSGISGASTPVAVASPSPTSSGTPSATATRDHLLHRTILGPWWGTGCPKTGDCGCGSAETMAEEFTCQMDEIRAADLPIGVYLFDGPGWSERDSRNDGTCSGDDCCSWNLGEDVTNRLATEHVKALVHFWGGCHERAQYARVRSQLGANLLGFYLDDGSSDQELQRVNDYMQSVAPGDFENVAKTNQSREPSTSDAGLSRMANVAYVADLANDFNGLREGIVRVLQKARFLPAPLNEFTAYDYEGRTSPDQETYIRRLHWGAFQPIMAHTPFANSDPWRSEYDGDLMSAYRYYSWLHKELTPYFMTYAQRMHESPTLPVLQAGPSAFSARVGDEIFVPFVTDRTPSIDIQLPAGQWVDSWDEDRVVSGSLSEFPAPVGHEPVFFKLGAIIPLEVERDYTGHGTRESAGSLTLLVYPSGTSTFRYNDDDNGVWTTFTSTVDGNRLTLAADTAVRLDLLYRVARVATKPSSVSVNGRTVLINQTTGRVLPEIDVEGDVNGSPVSAWFYDADAHRLIVKVVQ